MGATLPDLGSETSDAFVDSERASGLAMVSLVDAQGPAEPEAT